MITCTRRVQFCAGHRVLRHESKCRHPHGHNYVVFFTAQGPLDDIGRVIDFGVLKERLGGWIDEYWDHGFLYWNEDREMAQVIAEHKHFALPYNPTAENMARYLLGRGPDLLRGTSVTLIKVRVWETENCYADAELSSQ